MGPVVCHSFYAASWLPAVVLVLLAVLHATHAVDHREELIMLRSPEPIAVPIGDEVTLTCEMNVKADSFRWRHFPISSPFSNAPIKIDRDPSYEVPAYMYTYSSSGKGTTITINVNSTSIAGDYQCLVSYGASVLASVPGRITIAEIDRFPPTRSPRYSVPAGNTVAIKCDLPPSNPQASVEYLRNNVSLDQSLVLPTMSLLLQNISRADYGTYTCSASNYITGDTIISAQKIILGVTNSRTKEEPRFLTIPPNNYTATAGANVFMECTAVGYPPPSVTWSKLGGEINSRKTQMLPGGLLVNNVTSKDQGTYVCAHGHLEHHVSLLFYEKPSVIFTYSSRITEGEDLDLECTVRGTPEPDISWLLNGRSVLNETNIEVIGNKIYFRPLEKKDAGILQCMASNVVGASYEFIFLKIIPKQIPTPTDPMNHKNSESPDKTTRKPKKSRPSKNPVMIPPSKPIVTRLSDESVMVRWTVPENEGLPIQFFKVQYRELGPASQSGAGGGGGRNKGWKTTNADIIPYLRSYQVDNLKSDHIYRFRIAAVYSNNDNKLGPNSAKFHLKREDFAKDPLPAPRLTRSEALSADSIKIYWDYLQKDVNITIDGFYVNYQLASSAGDYFKVTVLGEHAKSYVIRHLQPDTAYDIKLQSYTSSGPSDFSAVLQQKTLRLPPEEVTTLAPAKNLPSSSGPSQLYIIIGAAVAVVALVLGAVAAIIIIKKKKNKEPKDDEDNGDKSGGNEDRRHHINANGYTTKAIPRGLSNGCAPNRITITANPLADADDNQNQNMIEMSCLSSQNNNCAAVEPSASNEDVQPTSPKIKNTDNTMARGKLKTEVTAVENFV